ncbi:MAG: coproporphyrinogen III oxidase [Thermodesulfatator sp.]|nr:MAG: coproporphyrinogen III oxidase [Thermodesulfatator sp.]
MAGLYVHVPFCRKKCSYCSFVSFSGRNALMKDYFQALRKEISLWGESGRVQDLVFDSIYIGGGTPSLAPVEYICQLLEHAFKVLNFKAMPHLEVTMECNPDSVDGARLLELRKSGLNRVSLGVQSMSERDLEFLGRIHGNSQVIDAVHAIREAGIENMSLDLIYSIPGQDEAALADCLARVFDLDPEHLSCYELSVEEGTPLEQAARRGDFRMPSQETRLSLTLLVEKELRAHGYKQYEISNYSRPGFECRHNIGYWTGREYVGIGCSACSFVAKRRIRNLEGLEAYMNAVMHGRLPCDKLEELDRESMFREAFVIFLRMNQGADLHELAERFGIEPNAYYGSLLEQMVSNGLMYSFNRGRRIALTPRGRHIANYVLSHFV